LHLLERNTPTPNLIPWNAPPKWHTRNAQSERW
jgi:hypothetical protein